jgi:hypothetical protein
MKNNSFFQENSGLGESGSELVLLLDQYFESIYSKYIAKGYPLREITQLMLGAITLTESKVCMQHTNEYEEKLKLQRISEARASKEQPEKKKRTSKK